MPMKTYVATQDTDILYTFKHGGGIKGRTVKEGEKVTFLGTMNDINTRSVACLELLHRVEENAFNKIFALCIE